MFEDITGLGKFGVKLLDSLDKVTGALFEPKQLKRIAAAKRQILIEDATTETEAAKIKAQGEVEADRIKALGRVELTSEVIAKEAELLTPYIAANQRPQLTDNLGGRALQRMAAREVRRQHNLESIVGQALLETPQEVNDEPVNTDWVQSFLGNSQDVSDEQMQLVWARILAGEVAKPGSFSKRTLAFVKDMEVNDAGLFTAACSLLIDNRKVPKYPFVLDCGPLYDPNSKTPNSVRLMLEHLNDIGLFSIDRRYLQFDKPKLLKYGDTKFDVKGDENPGMKTLPKFYPIANLTPIGHQLWPIAGAETIDDYADELIMWFESEGLQVYRV